MVDSNGEGEDERGLNKISTETLMKIKKGQSNEIG